MALGNKRVILLMLEIVVLSALFGISLGKSRVVGGSGGWTIPTTTSLYSAWASQQNLQVGDVLVFRFPAGMHTVAEVSKANYDACTSTSTLGPVMTTAPASITLNKPGTHYFICTIPGHCSANQKLTVTVTVPASTTTTTTPAPQPSPSSQKGASPTSSPTSSRATSPAFSPTAAPTPAPAGAPITTPASPLVPTPVASGPGIGSPMGGATVPAAAEGPSGGSDGGAASPRAGNFATSTGVSLLSLFSAVALALVF